MTKRLIRSVPPEGAAAPLRRAAAPWRTQHALKGASFALPFFVGFLALYVLPILYAVHQAFYATRSSGLGFGGSTTEFVGLANFREGLTDGAFWAAVTRVLAFAMVQIPIMLGVALAMALLLDASRRRTAQIFRLGILVPYMVPAMVGALIWVYLYSPSVGPLTKILGQVGVDVNFFGSQMLWLSMGNMLTWTVASFNMLILYSALQSVPRDMFEAARLDGASEWRIAWSIKVPHVRPTLVLTGVLSIIGMLQIFNEPLLFRSFSPQTVTKDFTPILMIFNEAFDNSNYNYAAALSVILAVVVGVVSIGFYRVMNRTAS